MASRKVLGFNYEGYEQIAEKFCLSAAVSVRLTGTRLIVTSGHVGLDENGQISRSLDEQMRLAFQNVEKSIRVVDHDLTSADVWSSIYQVTTYHVGGVGEEVLDIMAKTARSFMGSHRPAWAAVGVDSLAVGDFEISVSAVF